jgi:NAD(P)-dependent dehydrogenase (short-subunit alcohol dehydrogenase family)
VVVADISEQGGRKTARMIEELGGQAIAVKCDVSRVEDVRSALDKTIERFGRLDIAFNNAGIEQEMGAAADITVDEFDRIIATNLRGAFLCMKYEISMMLQRGGGAIVNTSSAAGLVGVQGTATYTASKHGIVGLTRAAALDYAASSIRINAVCPGFIDTPMIQRFTKGNPEGRSQAVAMEPIGRMGKPKEIAAAVLGLCSDAASFVTGHALAVDGGFVVP